MAATIAVLGSALTTTAGNKTVTATPTVGDLIVVIAVATGVTTTVADNGTGGTYTQVGTTRTGFSTTGNLQIFIRNNIIASSVSTIYTATQTSSTGGGLVVLRVTGVTATGSAAVRSSGGQSTGTAGTTPAPVLNLTPLTTNAIITAVANASNSTTTLVQRTGYAEDFDNGYNTPPTGLEVNHLLSGETSATLTQGGTSATAFASQSIELIVNQPPTTALNTPADTATGVSTTPTLNFTGTDADSNAVEYDVQVDTVNTFDSQGTTSPISDDFQDNFIDPGLWNLLPAGAPQIAETNRELEITTTGVSGNYYSLVSNNNFNMTGTGFSVQIVDAASTLTNVNGVPIVVSDSSTLANNNKLFFSIDGSGGTVNLLCFKVVSTVQTQVGSTVAFNATTHKFLRIREASGTCFFDCSADGVSWTNLTSLLNPFAVTALYFGIQAGQYGVQASTYTYKFDSVGPRPLLHAFSTLDTGFTAGHPFTSGVAKDFTVQVADTLPAGTLLYWKVRSTDPTGSNTYGAYATTRSFTTASSTVAPTVTDSAATSVGQFVATGNGNVTSDGGVTITARGFVYSVTATNSNPLIGGTGVTDTGNLGGTTGAFTGSLSSLSANTGYSYKAYATNSVGTSYGSVQTFTTVAISAASTLSDNFDDNSIDNTKWNTGSTLGTIAETNQEFEITGPANSTQYGGMDALNHFDLTGSYFSDQVVDAGPQTTVASWEVYPIQVIKDASNSLKWVITGNTLIAIVTVAGTPTNHGSTTYNSAVHKYFKIRESAGTVYFDYSTDGITYTNYYSQANPFAINNIYQEFSAGKWAVDTTVCVAKFDNFNIAPSTSQNFSGLLTMGVG